MKNAIIAIVGLLATLLLVNSVLLVAAEENKPAKKPKLVTLEDTIKTAKQDNKDIVLDLTVSDMELCQKLDKEVFNTEKWKKDSTKKYIFIRLDYAQGDVVSPEQKEYNEKLRNEFGVDKYPVVFVLDSTGKPYARTGYLQDSPGAKNFLDYLGQLNSRKKERDDWFKRAKGAATKEKRVTALEDLMKKLNEWEVGYLYPEVKEELVASYGDSNDHSKSQYATDLVYYYYYVKKDKKKLDFYLEIVRDYDAQKAANIEVRFQIPEIEEKYINTEDWPNAIEPLKKLLEMKPDGEVKQIILFYLAFAYAKTNDGDKAYTTMDKALKCAPDSRLANERIKNILNDWKQQREKNGGGAPPLDKGNQ